MVAPAVWEGNEAWPGTGAWEDSERSPTIPKDYDNYDTDEPAVGDTASPTTNAQNKRNDTWGKLRIIAGAVGGVGVAANNHTDQEEDKVVITPRTSALRRVLGQDLEEQLHCGASGKRLKGFETVIRYVESATISKSATVLLDPTLGLEPVSRALFVEVVFDVALKALSDPSEAIRACTCTFVESVLVTLRAHTIKEELVPLVRGVMWSILGEGMKNQHPGVIEEELLKTLMQEKCIGVKGVVAALYEFVNHPEKIVGNGCHDWVLRLIAQMLPEHHILPAGELPLESTATYAIRALESGSPNRRQLGMTVLMALYRLAQKRLEPLIQGLKPQLHRRLTDEFSRVDDEVRGQARKRRSSVSSQGNRAGTRGTSRGTSSSNQTDWAAPVIMNTGVLLKSVKQRRGKSESDTELLSRVTHLHCANKRIGEISGLEQTRRVQVLYLNDNFIPRIENLSCLKNTLSHLYLQNNQILELQGLEELPNLTKLYLDKNRIAHIGGLENCVRLEELHVSHQQLPEGVHMSFCPSSLQAMARSLRLLEAADCKVADVTPLYALQRLDSLDLSGSEVSSVQAINALIARCPFLTKLDLSNSPVVKSRKNCEEIIACADYIEEFNGKEVTAKERDFLRRFAQRKMQMANRGRRASISEGQAAPSRLPTVAEDTAYALAAFGRRGSV